jgi:rhodanese-related sulfurtransferase
MPVAEVSVQDLKARLDAVGAPLLLDVREAWELELAALPQATHISMNEVPARFAELDRDREIVVMCHGGVRSLRVAEFLAAKGFSRVGNLTGGIHAWSQVIDPGVPVY